MGHSRIEADRTRLPDALEKLTMTGAAAEVYRFSERNRQLSALAFYSAITVSAYLLAFLLRFDFNIPTPHDSVFLFTLPMLLVVRLVCHRIFAVTLGRWRFVGPDDVLRLAGSVMVGSVIFAPLTMLMPLPARVPRSILVLEPLLALQLTAAVWLAYRLSFEALRLRRYAANGTMRRVIVIGAGEAASVLVREMRRTPTGFRPVGYVDDDRNKWGTTLQGLRVFGPVASLPSLAAELNAEELVIAIPSAGPAKIRSLVEQCEGTGLPFKVLPGVSSVLAGKVSVGQLRALRIEDLLGREPVSLALPELLDDVRGESVLITGAAGSIGSELARQVALHSPGLLVLLDQAETPLFYLERELSAAHPDLRIVATIGDIVDGRFIDRVFSVYGPSKVYHAAAYKHVPMMQPAPREALRNNVLGTWLVGAAAGRSGADKFVLVSTDKAVRPTSVMGASKRLAEVAVLTLQGHHPRTMYSAVRFGNVLGSSGSVIPIFQQQIAESRPLTVTHPDATRYFMTIPEAVQLILQASLLPEMRGAVAMLEMGEPVRIVDLAHNLLRLSGRGTDNGCIVFTGLRPGEKLHEELWGPDEASVPTSIPKVSIVKPTDLSISDLDQCLRDWEQRYSDEGDEGVVEALHGVFPELHRTPHIDAAAGVHEYPHFRRIAAVRSAGQKSRK
jgi:FlaA1/EpsC-like NDP-sugar epimerase